MNFLLYFLMLILKNIIFAIICTFFAIKIGICGGITYKIKDTKTYYFEHINIKKGYFYNSFTCLEYNRSNNDLNIYVNTHKKNSLKPITVYHYNLEGLKKKYIF